jgi:polysaccharide export outer membrane protein
MSIRTFCVALAVGLLAAASGHAQTPAAQPSTNATSPPAGIADSTSSAYILGRDDVIEVGLLGASGFGGRTRVQADGTIQLPLIGKVPVADRTTAEVSELLRKALVAGQFFTDPVVTVEVVGYASRYVTVLGQVGSPGLIPINKPYRLSEILARVGGVRDGAADHLVVRSDDGNESKYLIRDLATGGDAQDPHVKAGDKIFAPVAETFYVSGKVNSPGQLALTSDTTVRVAIARAGGLAESGSDKKVTVTRGGKKTKLKLDDKVEPGDVIEIGERLF